MKSLVIAATIASVLVVSPVAFAKKPAKKTAPETTAASASTPEETPAPLPSLPPPPPPVVAAPAAPAPAPVANEKAEKEEPTAGERATRIEAVAGKTEGLGEALGFRMGHRSTNNVYFGGSLMFQTGVSGGIVTYPGAELGYDFGASAPSSSSSSVRIMPYVGAAPLFIIPTATADAPTVKALVYPGLAVHYEASRFVAGADARFLYVMASDTTLISINLTAGFRF